MAININPPKRQYQREPTFLPQQQNVPLPSSIGLPPKYTTFRDGQWEYIDAVLRSPKRFKGLQLPVGSGKTGIEYGAARLGLGRGAILTATKTLSDQILDDGFQLTDIRGLNNYPCHALNPGGQWHHISNINNNPNVGLSCEDGPCMFGLGCDLKYGGCDYFDKVRLAKMDKVVSTNYSYFMHQIAAQNTIGKFNWLFCDEAHDAVDQITKFMTVELSVDEVERVCGEQWIGSVELGVWREWASRVMPRLNRRYVDLQNEAAMSPSRVLFKQMRAVRKTLQKLVKVAGAVDWIVFPTSDHSIGFSPIWPNKRAELVLFNQIPNICLVSGTLTRKTMELLGVEEDEYEYFEAGSRFPIENRPIYWVRTANIRHGTDISQLRYWVARMDQIGNMWGDEKGIIHTTSYAYRDYIMNNSELRGRMITHDRKDARRKIEEFKQSTQPLILVSPSVGTGHDFLDNLARWQIISKVPFLDTTDPLVNARCKEDREYGMHLTGQKLVQMSGRVVRSETDWGVTYILDDSIGWYLKQYHVFVPYWWLEAFEDVKVVPPRRWGR